MKEFKNHPNYNCKITTDTGEEYHIYANWMHNENLDHWKGYQCDAGYKRFYLDKNFDVWSGECENDYLGNALGEWTIKQDTICKKEICGSCTDDLIVGKQKIDD